MAQYAAEISEYKDRKKLVSLAQDLIDKEEATQGERCSDGDE